jgi:hypothetical protein
MQPFFILYSVLGCVLMKPPNPTALQRRVIQYIEEHGGMLAAAHALGVHRSYLWRLREGQCVSPGDKLLEKLGYRRVERLVEL